MNHADGMVDKEELTLARRQLTAAKAREARQKKQIDKLEDKIKQLEKEVWDWSEQCGNLREELDGHHAAEAARLSGGGSPE